MHSDNTFAIERIAKVAAASLVLASTGFGAVYAYKVGSEHSILLGLLTILFAVALELIKPLAIAAAFNAFAEWAIMRGIAMALLGLVGVAYSLSAELSLISLSRGDLAAHRASAARQGALQVERIESARRELAGLSATRSIPELEALVDATPCVSVRTVVVTHGKRDTPTQLNCTKQMRVKAELGRAKRKAELESLIADAATSKDGPTVVENSDPGAANLAAYLNALGVNVSSATIAQWLVLIPTLAIELGSALAAVLVSSINSETKSSVAQPKDSSIAQPATPKDNAAQPTTPLSSAAQLPETSETAKFSGLERLISMSQLALQPTAQAISPATAQLGSNVIPINPYVSRPRAHTRLEAEAEIVKQLQQHGTSAIFGAQRNMAYACGIDRSTFNRAASELAKRGIITVRQEGNRVVMQLAS